MLTEPVRKQIMKCLFPKSGIHSKPFIFLAGNSVAEAGTKNTEY